MRKISSKTNHYKFTDGIVDQVETGKRDFRRQRNSSGSRQGGNFTFEVYSRLESIQPSMASC